MKSGDIVKVKVLEVEVDRKRIALTLGWMTRSAPRASDRRRASAENSRAVEDVGRCEAPAPGGGEDIGRSLAPRRGEVGGTRTMMVSALLRFATAPEAGV